MVGYLQIHNKGYLDILNPIVSEMVLAQKAAIVLSLVSQERVILALVVKKSDRRQLILVPRTCFYLENSLYFQFSNLVPFNFR